MAKCTHCGNNPTPHFFAWLSESGIVVMTPFNRWVLHNPVGRYIDQLFDKLFLLFIGLLRILRIAKFDSDFDRATIIRTKVFWEEALRRGIQMENLRILNKEVDFYKAVVGNKKIYFTSLPRPQNYRGDAIYWMDDKGALKRKFIEAEIPVARGGVFTSYQQLVKHFREIEKPVIVKPRLGSRGRHTTTFIFTEEQLTQAFERAKELCHWVIMEEHLVGGVFRGTVIGGKVVGVLGGDPPRVTGDGIHTIRELIFLKNAARPERVGEVVISPSLTEFLARQGFRLETILPTGKVVDLSEKIGVAYGGTSYEITEETHPEIKATLERAAGVVNDPLLGFDFIIADPTQSPEEQKWGIIECNGMPFINLHHYPLYGKPNNVARHLWDLLEREG